MPASIDCFLCRCTFDRALDTSQGHNPLCPACEPHRAVLLGNHTVSMNGGAGQAYMAVCACGWQIPRDMKTPNAFLAEDAAIRRHWQAMVAQANDPSHPS